MPEATIRLGGGGKVLGVDVAPGFFPEGISATATDWGSDTLTFSIRRDAAIPDIELAAYTAVTLEVGGVTCWSGFIWETPASATHITVSCRGWQYHLDDDQQIVNYVHATLGDYVDQRDIASANLGKYTPDWAKAQPGALAIAGNPALTVVADTRSGVTLDLGYAGAAKRISVDWLSTNNDANTFFFARAHDLPSEVGSGATSTAFNFAMNTGAFGTTSGTFATPYRYVTCFLYANTTHVVPAAGVQLQITGIRVYSQTPYESGNQSALKASTVLAAELGLLTQLQQDAGALGVTAFNIPELAPRAYMTPRQRIQAANAFHDWQVQVTPEKRLRYRARPAAAAVEVGAWGGSSFEDAAISSGEEIYNQVIVQATDSARAAIFSVRTATSTLLTRAGRTRTFTLNTGATLTQAAADAIGDAWLASRAKTPLRGGLTVWGSDGARLTNGQPVEPYELLMLAGEMVRLTDRPDPDTGRWGRQGTIQSVTYDHTAGSAVCAIDSPRDHLDALLARLGIVETGVLT